MLSTIRGMLRVPGTEYDTEIQLLINACKADLSQSGLIVEMLGDDDPLLIQTVACYCKAYFGLENKDKEGYEKSYDKLKSDLLVSSGLVSD